VAGAGAYLLHAVGRSRSSALLAPPAGSVSLLAAGDVPAAGPLLVFRRSALDQYAGATGIAAVADPSTARFVPGLRCERVHMAGRHGVCLTADRGVFTTYRAVLFDGTFQPRGELPLAGIPSRVQVAPDGRLAATTVFVTGHAYSDAGFSTRTSILDVARAQWLVEDLETFTVRRQGEVLRSPDFNFWGVTFTRDARTFYATLGTRSETLLVRGDVAARTAEVVADGVECPSLSPGERRIAFKQRTGGVTSAVAWRLWVLDVETSERHPLAELRSVDDQAQWLDDERVMYALPRPGDQAAIMDVWVVPADGRGEPLRLLAEASSAGVAR
jgi:hypothetical protein